MAFALTKFMAVGVDYAGVSNRNGVQKVIMNITGTTSDVALDIGTAAGTFWTAAIANATYGTIATAALAKLQAIAANSPALFRVNSMKLLPRVQVATLTAAGQFTLAVGVIGPNIAFNAADGETSIVLNLEYALPDFVFPIISQIG